MADESGTRAIAWWQLGRLEQVALALGAAIGLGAATPLIWLSAEAQRTGHAELTAAALLRPAQLLLVWLVGTLVGGVYAAQLVRHSLRPRPATTTLRHLLRLGAGLAMIVVLAPLPLAVLSMFFSPQPESFRLYYISAGGLIGWQPGVISFVFLYTFKALELRKNSNGCQLAAKQLRTPGAPTEEP